MHITLIKPSLGDSNQTFKLNDGSMEPMPLAILAGLIKSPDQVVMWDDRLEAIPFDRQTDLVCITVDTFNARRSYQISAEYRKRGVPVILGGMHVSILPEEASKQADAIVLGDAEPVWDQLMSDVRKASLQKIYQAPFGIPQENCNPDRSIFKGKNYLPISLVQFSRGCHFNCSFCSVSRFFNKSYKCRPWEDVIREIEENNLKTVLFVDDNMVSEKAELKTFLKELIPLKIKWASQTSINMVNDRELLKLMADSGCIGNLIGFESININSLDWFNKSPNTRNFNQYAEAIEILRDYGFMTWASFIMGNDFDTLEIMEKTVEFAIKNKFALAYFHILMPYPGTKVYEQFKTENRLLYDGEWWNHPDYRYNMATFLPKNMSPEQLSEATMKANKDFYGVSSIVNRMFEPNTNLKNLVNFLIYSKFNYILRTTST